MARVVVWVAFLMVRVTLLVEVWVEARAGVGIGRKRVR